jgi:hypothetical protein
LSAVLRCGAPAPAVWMMGLALSLSAMVEVLW